MFRSPFPSITIPAMSLAEFALQQASAWADWEAIVDGPTGRTLTYQQVLDGVPHVVVPDDPERFRSGSGGLCVPLLEARIVDLKTGAHVGPHLKSPRLSWRRFC